MSAELAFMLLQPLGKVRPSGGTNHPARVAAAISAVETSMARLIQASLFRRIGSGSVIERAVSLGILGARDAEFWERDEIPFEIRINCKLSGERRRPAMAWDCGHVTMQFRVFRGPKQDSIMIDQMTAGNGLAAH